MYKPTRCCLLIRVNVFINLWWTHPNSKVMIHSFTFLYSYNLILKLCYFQCCWNLNKTVTKKANAFLEIKNRTGQAIIACLFYKGSMLCGKPRRWPLNRKVQISLEPYLSILAFCQRGDVRLWFSPSMTAAKMTLLILHILHQWRP